MPSKSIVESARSLCTPFRVEDGRGFRLKDIDPGETLGFGSEDKPRAKEALEAGVRALADLQELLFAQDRWSVLLIFQAMDAAGKDGIIKHVMSGVNPQGCQVHAFKAPSDEELDHDYMWRCASRLPERGRIGIFNRSYYEEVLVVRVRPEALAAQKLPASLVTKRIWRERYEDIRAFERYLGRNGVLVLKFFLHVSKEEQRRRFIERIDDPAKRWKFAVGDVQERARWKAYMDAYEEMIRETSTRRAAWHVVPADNKWFTRIVVAASIIDAMSALDLSLPKEGRARRLELERARRALLSERRRDRR